MWIQSIVVNQDTRKAWHLYDKNTQKRATTVLLQYYIIFIANISWESPAVPCMHYTMENMTCSMHKSMSTHRCSYINNVTATSLPWIGHTVTIRKKVHNLTHIQLKRRLPRIFHAGCKFWSKPVWITSYFMSWFISCSFYIQVPRFFHGPDGYHLAPKGLVAQLVEHHTGDVSVWIWSSLRSWDFFHEKKILGLLYIQVLQLISFHVKVP